jgi:hypothetical protein
MLSINVKRTLAIAMHGTCGDRVDRDQYTLSRPLHVAADKNEVAIETIEAPAAPHEAPSVRTPRARA